MTRRYGSKATLILFTVLAVTAGACSNSKPAANAPSSTTESAADTATEQQALNTTPPTPATTTIPQATELTADLKPIGVKATGSSFVDVAHTDTGAVAIMRDLDGGTESFSLWTTTPQFEWTKSPLQITSFEPRQVGYANGTYMIAGSDSSSAQRKAAVVQLPSTDVTDMPPPIVLPVGPRADVTDDLVYRVFFDSGNWWAVTWSFATKTSSFYRSVDGLNWIDAPGTQEADKDTDTWDITPDGVIIVFEPDSANDVTQTEATETTRSVLIAEDGTVTPLKGLPALPNRFDVVSNDKTTVLISLDFEPDESPPAFELQGDSWVKRRQTNRDASNRKVGLDAVTFLAEEAGAFYMVGRLYDSQTVLRSTDGLNWKETSRPSITVRNHLNQDLSFAVVGDVPTLFLGSTMQTFKSGRNPDVVVRGLPLGQVSTDQATHAVLDGRQVVAAWEVTQASAKGDARQTTRLYDFAKDAELQQFPDAKLEFSRFDRSPTLDGTKDVYDRGWNRRVGTAMVASPTNESMLTQRWEQRVDPTAGRYLSYRSKTFSMDGHKAINAGFISKGNYVTFETTLLETKQHTEPGSLSASESKFIPVPEEYDTHPTVCATRDGFLTFGKKDALSPIQPFALRTTADRPEWVALAGSSIEIDVPIDQVDLHCDLQPDGSFTIHVESFEQVVSAELTDTGSLQTLQSPRAPSVTSNIAWWDHPTRSVSIKVSTPNTDLVSTSLSLSVGDKLISTVPLKLSDGSPTSGNLELVTFTDSAITASMIRHGQLYRLDISLPPQWAAAISTAETFTPANG
jgi:hypothetical protein